jgi:hypothetical protein
MKIVIVIVIAIVFVIVIVIFKQQIKLVALKGVLILPTLL